MGNFGFKLQVLGENLLLEYKFYTDSGIKLF